MARGRKPAEVKGVYERPVGSGNYIIRYRQDGHDVRKTFGKNHAAAVAYLEKLRTIKRSGDGFVPATAKDYVQTKAEKAERLSAVTLGELCDDLKDYISKHPTQYKDQLNPPQRLDRIKADLGNRSASSIRPKDVENWLDGLVNAHAQKGKGKLLADATVNRYRVTLSSVYSRGIKREKVAQNPVRSTSQRKLKNGVIRWLKADEEKAIRAAIQKRIDTAIDEDRLDYAKHQRHHMCEFVISFQTGMRAGEQYGLTWPDVDLKNKLIHVRESKNGTERYIPCLPEVVTSFKLLRSMGLTRKDRAEDQPNESPEDCCFALADPKKWWHAVLKEAKVKKYRWHDNRHSFCSRLVQAGKSLKVVQELAGHRDIKMTARYAHLDQRSKREALEDAFAPAA